MSGGGYAAGASGWQIAADGSAEFNTLTARGAFRASVFQYQEVAAVGGQLLVANAGIVRAAVTTPASAAQCFSLDVVDPEVGHAAQFAADDILRVQTWNGSALISAWGTVTAVTDCTTYYRYTVRLEAGTSQAIPARAAVVSYGTAAAGGGIINVGAGTCSPYIDAFTTGAAPWTSITPQVRLGNLSGIAGLSGYGLYTNNGNIYGGVVRSNTFDCTTGSCFGLACGLLQLGGCCGGVTKAGLCWDGAALGIYGSATIAGGTIGGFTISPTFICTCCAGMASYTGCGCIVMWAGCSTAASAPFRIEAQGVVNAQTIQGNSATYYVVSGNTCIWSPLVCANALCVMGDAYVSGDVLASTWVCVPITGMSGGVKLLGTCCGGSFTIFNATHNPCIYSPYILTISDGSKGLWLENRTVTDTSGYTGMVIASSLRSDGGCVSNSCIVHIFNGSNLVSWIGPTGNTYSCSCFCAPVICGTTCVCSNCVSGCLVCASTASAGIVLGSTCGCFGYLYVPTGGAVVCRPSAGTTALYGGNLVSSGSSVGVLGDALDGLGVLGRVSSTGCGVTGCSSCCAGYSGFFYGGNFLICLCSTSQAFKVKNLATGTGTAIVVVDAGGQFVCASSARATKCCIAPWALPCDFLDCFEPSRYLYCSGLNGGSPYLVGAIADDMAPWAPWAVRCDHGKPATVAYESLGVAALSGLKIERDERREEDSALWKCIREMRLELDIARGRRS